jgi:hypothetical protein
MTWRDPRRVGILAAFGLALLPVLTTVAAPPKEPPKPQEFTGKVRPLSAVLKESGATLDADASPHWLALVGDDGKALPLIKDDGSRMFFKDERLLNRPMRLTARLIPEVGMLQVVQVHSLRDGKPQDLYYWCDICSIRRLEQMACVCCGGPMELREEPLPK